MPIYEYLCHSCGFVFDELRPMNASDEPIHCAHCSSIDTKRQLSTFFSHSQGKNITSNQKSCGNCSGKNCSSCN